MPPAETNVTIAGRSALCPLVCAGRKAASHGLTCAHAWSSAAVASVPDSRGSRSGTPARRPLLCPGRDAPRASAPVSVRPAGDTPPPSAIRDSRCRSGPLRLSGPPTMSLPRAARRSWELTAERATNERGESSPLLDSRGRPPYRQRHGGFTPSTQRSIHVKDCNELQTYCRLTAIRPLTFPCPRRIIALTTEEYYGHRDSSNLSGRHLQTAGCG